MVDVAVSNCCHNQGADINDLQAFQMRDCNHA